MQDFFFHLILQILTFGYDTLAENGLRMGGI